MDMNRMVSMFWDESKYKDNGEEIRDERIYIRLTKTEKDQIKKLAKCQHLSVADFVRWLIFSKYVNDFLEVND